MDLTPEQAALAVERHDCANCDAPAGSACRTRGGKITAKYHTPRFVRRAHACGVERRRTRPSSAARSPSDRVNSAFGRPVRATPHPCTSEQNC
ncbi:zinc finger domain-containing protein [Streptomyces sp. NPDC054834]